MPGRWRLGREMSAATDNGTDSTTLMCLGSARSRPFVSQTISFSRLMAQPYAKGPSVPNERAGAHRGRLGPSPALAAIGWPLSVSELAPLSSPSRTLFQWTSSTARHRPRRPALFSLVHEAAHHIRLHQDQLTAGIDAPACRLPTASYSALEASARWGRQRNKLLARR
jgi:hypothetical protein